MDDSDSCPVHRCADLICGKWTVLVIRDLLDGPRYFSELETSLSGISPRTLCDRLKVLEQAEILTRTYIKGLPPRVMYELTDKGRGLEPVVDAMRAYCAEWLDCDLEHAEPATRSAPASARLTV